IHLVQKELSSLECLMIAGSVFGMASVMLIEAFLLGKPVTSLQPGMKGEDRLVLSRHGLIRRITGCEGFDPFCPVKTDPSGFDVSFDETAFLDFLEERLALQSTV
ncbi:MAG: hypothetical protein HGA78_07115, partial [Nitrospirales bacterium]|nr:hypothetical protein [Nitrospirales bacterium]